MDELPVRPQQRMPLTLVSLPVEIQEAVLSQLDSTRTLKSAAGSCRSFRDLVLYHPNGIIKQILWSSIPDDVFPEALAFNRSLNFPTTNADTVQNLLDDYFESLKRKEAPRPNISLSEATDLENFHRLIKRFTSAFISKALSKHPITGVEEKPLWPATKREAYRIQRAFYRFELYWKLFKGTIKERPPGRYKRLAIPLKDHSKLFFDRFAPWENEQLVCINDFLLRIIDEAYNDVSAHDVEWGELGIPYNEGYNAWSISGYRYNYISLGLKFILRLARTKKYKHRREILDSHRIMVYGPCSVIRI